MSHSFISGFFQEVNLSRNNLIREIPKDLQDLPFLRYLNLSLNDLQGEVKFQREESTVLSLITSSELSRGVPQLLLPKCPRKAVKKRDLSSTKDSNSINLCSTWTCVHSSLCSSLSKKEVWNEFVYYARLDGPVCQGIFS
ncbi:hypothetical protein M5689_018297 [Euphorbia peplus]|nr:hypothetical protein M5689_018297 [Euphorbia peplus]